MLEIITLQVLRNIFDIECSKKLSAMGKMVYINSLIWHFEDKEPNHANLKGFDISRLKIKNYSKFSNYYEEMQRCGLVVVNEKTITFLDVWSKHIDKKRLERITPDEFVAMSNLKEIDAFEHELIGNRGLFELARMKHKLNEQQVSKMVEIFIKEQKTTKKLYSGASDCIRHCTNWISTNHEKLRTAVTAQKIGGKILGLEP